MLRIAHTTWFETTNYGSILQAFALDAALRGFGCDVKIVNYDPAPRQWAGKLPLKRSRPFRFARQLQLDVTGAAVYRPPAMLDLFRGFSDCYFRLTGPVSSDEDFREIDRQFDGFVCGSDQIWSPRCFDPRYFLDYVSEPERKVAYAPSFGCDAIPHESEEPIRLLVASFAHLSAREASGARLVESMTGKPCEVVLDPTLLMDGVAWRPVSSRAAVPRGPYCLFYFLGDNAGNWARAQRVAETLGLSPAVIPVFKRDLKRVGCIADPIGPAEFLGLVEGAEYVVTDSFHGLAFSTLFEKDFTVYERFAPDSAESQNTRITSYLDMLGLQERLSKRSDDPSVRPREPIDYAAPRSRLESMRKSSITYLSNAIGIGADTAADGDYNYGGVGR